MASEISCYTAGAMRSNDTTRALENSWSFGRFVTRLFGRFVTGSASLSRSANLTRSTSLPSSGRAGLSKLGLHGGRGTVLCLVALSLGCDAGGVGDPCTPEDEFSANFSGFSLSEVNIESRSFQCETRVCLVNKFQGRVSCPYGSNGSDDTSTTVDHQFGCNVPGIGGPVDVPVSAQLTERPPAQAVYCSCRCSGDDPNARYCECPSGFSCEEVVPSSSGGGSVELAGGYCIRTDSDVDPNEVSSEECSIPPVGQAPTGSQLSCGRGPEGS